MSDSADRGPHLSLVRGKLAQPGEPVEAAGGSA
jgi:hypothetical protein